MYALQHVLIAHHQLALPAAGNSALPLQVLATVVSNLVHYGYGLTANGFERLSQADADAVSDWWPEVEATLRKISGDDKDMGAHVVYKNFPKEVLDKSEAAYWLPQVLMYWGLPNELFTQPETERAPLPEAEVRLRMLRPANDSSLSRVRDDLLGQPARWTRDQWQQLSDVLGVVHAAVPLHAVPFKENMVELATYLLNQGLTANVRTATDVLRLAVGLSDGDVSLREPCKLNTFTRRDRRFLLGLLEGASSLSEDVARRPERFKRLLRALRPGDYAARFPRVVHVYDQLYNDTSEASWASGVEAGLLARDPAVLTQLAQRPGEFTRRLHHAILQLGPIGAQRYISVLPKLTVIQMLKMRRYLATINTRQFRTIAPKGNWSRLQVLDNPRSRYLTMPVLLDLDSAIGAELRRRLTDVVPSATVDPRLNEVSLPTNDGDLLPYGRGTAFYLPDDMTFLRTASYWSTGPTKQNLWFDNSWNFFDAAWKNLGACCWNAPKFHKAAVFSGDPTNSKDLQGRGCQLIDLYIDRLASRGVRYAVWNVLCYSRVAFDDANEVFASLQWGSKATKGKLFEPARCQLAFPITGANYTKYVAYLDVVERKIVYLDANLKGNVSSAASNGNTLANVMPAVQEYLNPLPTVGDLLRELPVGSDLIALYSDEDYDLTDRLAYVFRPSSDKGDFNALPLNDLLSAR